MNLKTENEVLLGRRVVAVSGQRDGLRTNYVGKMKPGTREVERRDLRVRAYLPPPAKSYYLRMAPKKIAKRHFHPFQEGKME